MVFVLLIERKKRDAALGPYARAATEEERQRIAQEVAEALNEA